MSDSQLPARRSEELPAFDPARSSRMLARGLAHLQQQEASLNCGITKEENHKNEPRVLWNCRLPNTVLPTVVAISQGLAFVVDEPNSEGTCSLFAIEVESGVVRWATTCPSAPEIVLDGGLVFAYEATNKALAFLSVIDAQSGILRWSQSGVWAGRSVKSEPVAYLASDVAVSAVEVATGTVRWSHEISGAAIVNYTDQTVFVADGFGIQAFDANDGGFIWQFRTGGYTYVKRATEFEVVVIDTSHNRRYGLDAMTGSEQWRSDLNESRQHPGVRINGRIFVSHAWQQQEPVLSHVSSLSALDAASSQELWKLEETNCWNLRVGPWTKDTLLLSVMKIGSSWPILKVVEQTSGKVLWSVTDWESRRRVKLELGLICVIRGEELVGLGGVSGCEVWRLTIGKPMDGEDWQFIDGLTYIPGEDWYVTDSTYITDGVSLYAIDCRLGQLSWCWRGESQNQAEAGSTKEMDDLLGEIRSNKISEVIDHGEIVIVSRGEIIHAFEAPSTVVG